MDKLYKDRLRYASWLTFNQSMCVQVDNQYSRTTGLYFYNINMPIEKLEKAFDNYLACEHDITKMFKRTYTETTESED